MITETAKARACSRRNLGVLFHHTLLPGTLLFVAIFGLPMAWILRDGLGPGATDSTGWEAVQRWLGTFHIGLVLLVLLALAVVSRALATRSGPLRERGGSRGGERR